MKIFIGLLSFYLVTSIRCECTSDSCSVIGKFFNSKHFSFKAHLTSFSDKSINSSHNRNVAESQFSSQIFALLEVSACDKQTNAMHSFVFRSHSYSFLLSGVHSILSRRIQSDCLVHQFQTLFPYHIQSNRWAWARSQ